MKRTTTTLILVIVALASAGAALAADPNTALKPYILASNDAGDMAGAEAGAREGLAAQGFEIVGEYSISETAKVLAVTSDELKQTAASSQFGGYGAAQRVSITKAGDKVQIAYTNPVYMANVYRMKGDLEGVAKKMEAALGAGKAFGSKKGITGKKLRKYHYMMMMPYFDDHTELASYATHDQAVSAVEAGLAAGKGGTAKIYRVDIPGKEEVLFGVALSKGDGADKKVMETTDIGDLKHTAYLPYEILVSGKKAYAQHGKFRIALSFPDLTMGTFMKISSAPKGIENALAAAAGK